MEVFVRTEGLAVRGVVELRMSPARAEERDDLSWLEASVAEVSNMLQGLFTLNTDGRAIETWDDVEHLSNGDEIVATPLTRDDARAKLAEDSVPLSGTAATAAVIASARDGNTHRIQLQSLAGISIDTPNFTATPLIAAIKAGHYSIAEFLLVSGANPSVKSLSGHSPLTTVMGLEEPHAFLSLLLRHGVPLSDFVCGRNAAERLDQIVSCGVDVSTYTSSQGRSLAVEAMANCNFLLCRALLEMGISLRDPTGEGIAALVRCNSVPPAVMDAALSAGLGGAVCAAPSGGIDTPLHYLARKGPAGAVARLLQAGADPNARNAKGRTPLHIAAQCSSTEVVEALITAGADVGAVSRCGIGCTPLHNAIRQRHAEVARVLIAAGAPLEVCDATGTTPLHKAAWMGQVPVVEALLQRGASPNVSNDRGTPAEAARARNHTEVLELIRRFAGASALA